VTDQWAVVELMGHLTVAGKVSEVELFGSKMGRIDVPAPDGGFVTQYFGGGSVYRISPCDEATARYRARENQPKLISPWELSRMLPKAQETAAAEDEYENQCLVPEGAMADASEDDDDMPD
jgi:hypothetical protein